jgi:hypothetical protein
MAIFSGPRTPRSILKNTTFSFWNPRVTSSLWQDVAGTIPAVVDSEVKRMDDLGGLGNHMIALSGSRTISNYTYTFKGPILRKENTQYYLEYDGDGAGLIISNAAGDWPQVTGNNNIGISLSVAFYTDSQQPSLPSSGLSGTWLGSDSLGNFGGVWWFGLRLNQEMMFYATMRNVENTAWISQWNEDNRYSNLSTSNWLDKKIIYTATGNVDSNTFGGKEWIYGTNTVEFSGVPFNDTSLLPVNFNNTFVIGARAPSNDNWISGRFYGGVMVAKEINDTERKVIEDMLYTNVFA